jgi:hypothetical protein
MECVSAAKDIKIIAKFLSYAFIEYRKTTISPGFIKLNYDITFDYVIM